MMTDSKPPLYIFLHLPKTGGITLRYHLIKRFGKRGTLFFSQSENKSFATAEGVNEYLSRLSDKEKDRVKVILGHEVYYGIHKYFPDRNPCYIAFFREPAKLYVSFYNFFKNKIDCGDQSVKAERADFVPLDVDLTFSNFLKFSPNLTYGYFENRLLLGNASFKTNYGRSNMPQIKKMLTDFLFIGLTENPDDFLFIYKLLGIRRFYGRKNMTKRFLVDEKKLNQKELAEATELDRELYLYAKKLNTNFVNSRFYQTIIRDKRWPSLSKVIFCVPDLFSNLAFAIMVFAKNCFKNQT